MLQVALRWSKGFVTGVVLMLAVLLFVTANAEAAPYQHVVDNSNKDRFQTYKKWDINTFNSEKHGKNYRATRPAKKGSARYKVKTPKTGWYTVCGTWPSNSRYNSRVPVKIKARGGVRTKYVNQRKNGGKWNKLGTWKLRKGDSYKIRVKRNSKRGGWIMADAFKIVKAPNSNGVSCRGTSAERGKQVVKAAKKYIGTSYGSKAGGLAECKPYRRMDCTCLTRTAYKDATNIDNLPDHPALQWNYGRKVFKPRPGDLLFYKEGTNEITHVGIYAGNNKVIHANTWSNDVRIAPMRWTGDGYIGARRLV